MNEKMSIKDSIQYLQPIANSASLPRYAEALNAAISAMREIEFTRNFIHDQGLDFALMGAWNDRKDHIADGGKKFSGRLQRVYEDSLGWVDRCIRCKTIVTGKEKECPNCGAKINLEVT